MSSPMREANTGPATYSGSDDQHQSSRQCSKTPRRLGDVVGGGTTWLKFSVTGTGHEGIERIFRHCCAERGTYASGLTENRWSDSPRQASLTQSRSVGSRSLAFAGLRLRRLRPIFRQARVRFDRNRHPRRGELLALVEELCAF